MTYDPNRSTTPEPGPSQAAWPTGTSTSPTIPIEPGPVTSPPPVLPTSKKGSGGRVLNIVLGVAVAVAIAGVAFAVGRTTAPAAATTGARGNFGANFPNASFIPRASGAPNFGGGRGAFGGGGLTIRGTVESVTGDTVTIKTANGQTLQVTTGTDTTYNTQTPASASDVTNGATVEVQLQLGAGNGGGFGGLQPGASGAPTGPVGTADSITVIP